jgi:hypothetical protein
MLNLMHNATAVAVDLYAMHGFRFVRHRCPANTGMTKYITCLKPASIYFISNSFVGNNYHDIFGVCAEHADEYRKDNVEHGQGYTEITCEEALIYEIMES